MTPSSRQRDGWRWPAFLLWTSFFAAGLFPEWVYYQLRAWGQVVTQRAMTNSLYLLPVAMAGFFAGFVFVRCREAGTGNAAMGKAMQVWILALVAFLPIRLEQIGDYLRIPEAEYRRLILGMATVKCISWLYLYSIVLRFHFWSGYRLFLRMPSVFPSGRTPEPAVSTSVASPAAPAVTSAELDDSPESVREHGL